MSINPKLTNFEQRLARDLSDPSFAAVFAREMEGIEVAKQIYGLRTAARMSQTRLAKLAGTTQQVISRVESADYRGHSCALLERIAAALGATLQLRLVPNPKPPAKANKGAAPRRAAAKPAKERPRAVRAVSRA